MLRSLVAFLPEICLLLTACILLLNAPPFLKHPLVPFVWVLCMIGVLTFVIVNPVLYGEHFCGTMRVDLVSLCEKMVILAFGLFWIEREGESCVLFLLSLLGACVVVSSHHMITVYMGIELHVLPLYGIIALRRDRPFAMEASLKYFIFGTAASLFILYGMGLIYGETGRMDLDSLQQGGGALAQAGYLFVLVGLLFKLAVVPFHAWIGDVYEGSTNDQVAFMGVVSKIMVFFLLLRIHQGSVLLSWVGIASILMGAFMALRQQNIRRLFAYGAIHQMGFVLLGIGSPLSSFFYFLVYAVAFSGFFFILKIRVKEGHRVEKVDDLKGLFRKSPLHAGMLLIMILLLAGIPLFPGFWVKFDILIDVVQRGQEIQAFLALVGSLVVLFHYLTFLWGMFFSNKDNQDNLQQ